MEQTTIGDPAAEELGYVAIATFADYQIAQEYALVILAMNLDCLITRGPDGDTLHSEPAFHGAIQREFALYRAEQENAVPSPEVAVFGSGLDLALTWIAALFFCFIQQDEVLGFTEAYLNSSVAVFANYEIYRSFTALFLHGDLHHLLSNVVFGVIFGVLVSISFRPILGWTLILLSGFLGNLMNAWLYFPEPHLSLGASTAVFGALGLLVASGLDQAWRERSYRKGLRAFAPLVGGLMIFSLNGIGGPGTDTTAHLTGMLAGILVGLPFARLIAGHSLSPESRLRA